MAAKFLNIVAGRLQQIAALVVSTGAGDADKLIATGADGRIDSSVLPVGIGADTKVIAASETLSAGNYVSVWNDSGTQKVRKADATAAGKEATGFVLAGAASGANATVFFEGTNTQLSGLTPGARYYLDTTAGAVVDTPPTGSGNVVQFIGTAVSATEISFEPDAGIILA
ncbi:MAG: hypothetical protein ACREVL_01155 [Solimonas sp.]